MTCFCGSAAVLRREALEIGLVAEQPKAVFHLPLDVKVTGAGELGKGRVAGRQAEENADAECEDEEAAHNRRQDRHPTF